MKLSIENIPYQKRGKFVKLKYYGTRGSLPVPGRDTIKYGGNTACVKIVTGSTIIILDAGSGLRILGKELLQSEFGNGRGTAHIFFSHAHWDHINGFPFFSPAYIPGNKFFLYGSEKSNSSLKQILSQQQNSVNFPVGLNEMSADLNFIRVDDGQDVHCSNVLVSCIALQHHHPTYTFSYRIDTGSCKIVYATDYEHLDGLDTRLVEFAKNADVLIYDTMFTPEEYNTNKRGWGHSTYKEGIKMAEAAQVKQLHLFHYSPDYSDQVVERMERDAQKLFPHTHAAKEGWEIEI